LADFNGTFSSPIFQVTLLSEAAPARASQFGNKLPVSAIDITETQTGKAGQWGQRLS
jgi:hypothetical protein